jgi:hypothetical protein
VVGGSGAHRDGGNNHQDKPYLPGTTTGGQPAVCCARSRSPRLPAASGDIGLVGVAALSSQRMGGRGGHRRWCFWRRCAMSSGDPGAGLPAASASCRACSAQLFPSLSGCSARGVNGAAWGAAAGASSSRRWSSDCGRSWRISDCRLPGRHARRRRNDLKLGLSGRRRKGQRLRLGLAFGSRPWSTHPLTRLRETPKAAAIAGMLFSILLIAVF